MAPLHSGLCYSTEMVSWWLISLGRPSTCGNYLMILPYYLYTTYTYKLYIYYTCTVYIYTWQSKHVESIYRYHCCLYLRKFLALLTPIHHVPSSWIVPRCNKVPALQGRWFFTDPAVGVGQNSWTHLVKIFQFNWLVNGCSVQCPTKMKPLQLHIFIITCV